MLFPPSLSVDKASGRTRQKVPLHSRKRNPIACEQCRTRKIRCESTIPGEAPCRQCERSGHQCIFQEMSPKVVVPKKDLLLLKERCEAFEKLILDGTSEQRLDDIKVLLNGLNQSASSSGSESLDMISLSADHSRDQTPFQLDSNMGDDIQTEPIIFAHHGLQDPSESHFYQQAIDHVSKFLLDNGLPSHYAQLNPDQTYGDLRMHNAIRPANKSRPLNLPAVDPYQLPSKSSTRFLIQVFSDYFGEKSPANSQPSISTLFHNSDIFNGGGYAAIPVDDIVLRAAEAAKHSRPDLTLAAVNMCFAISAHFLASLSDPGSEGLRRAQMWSSIPAIISQQYGELSSSGSEGSAVEASIVFFTRAKQLSGMDTIMDSSVATARLLSQMAFYLWSIDQGNMAYEHIGRAARIAMTTGLHLSPEFSDERDLFLSIFIMDRAISNAVGMPSLMITLPFRNNLEDTANVVLYHARVSLAAGDLTTEMWRTDNAGQDAGKLWLTVVDHTIDNITRIHEALPQELHLVDGIAQNRAALMINLRVLEATMAVTRPSLLTLLKAKQNANLNSHAIHPSCYQQVSVCMKATRECVALLHHMQAPHNFLETRLAKQAGFLLVVGQLSEYTAPEDSHLIATALDFLRRTDIPAARELEQLVTNVQRALSLQGAQFDQYQQPRSTIEDASTNAVGMGMPYEAPQILHYW